MKLLSSIAMVGTLGTSLAMLVGCGGSSSSPAPTSDTTEHPVAGKKPDTTATVKPPSAGATSGADATPTGSGTNATGGQDGKNGPDGQSDPDAQSDAGSQSDAGGMTSQKGNDGQNGQVGRVSVGPHCCYQGQYLECPTESACFGGFDIQACLGTCAQGDAACAGACVGKLDTSGPPVGCRAGVAEPAGVDCANGRIDL